MIFAAQKTRRLHKDERIQWLIENEPGDSKFDRRFQGMVLFEWLTSSWRGRAGTWRVDDRLFSAITYGALDYPGAPVSWDALNEGQTVERWEMVIRACQALRSLGEMQLFTDPDGDWGEDSKEAQHWIRMNVPSDRDLMAAATQQVRPEASWKGDSKSQSWAADTARSFWTVLKHLTISTEDCLRLFRDLRELALPEN
jgi:hypothetical protein